MSENHTSGVDEVTGELLFTDGLPKTNSEGGFSGSTIVNTIGITYRQLDYWARTELVVPSLRTASGSGSQRLYSFRDVLTLKLVKNLLDAGISLAKIRIAIERLEAAGVHDLSQTTLMSDGVGVYFCSSNDQVADLLNRGQGVFGIAVGKVIHEVEASLVNLDEYRSEGSLAKLAMEEELRQHRAANN